MLLHDSSYCFMKMPPFPSGYFVSNRRSKNDRDMTKQGCVAYAVQETRVNDCCVPLWPSDIFVSFIKSSSFSSHDPAKQHRITLISELFCVRNGVCVMMPGFGTFHRMKEQHLTLQLFTTQCAWPHLPFPLISTGNTPDTNHHQDPCPAKPIERVSIGLSGSRWKFCVPTFPLPVQYLEPQSCRPYSL